jgi:hypothetical protein
MPAVSLQLGLWLEEKARSAFPIPPRGLLTAYRENRSGRRYFDRDQRSGDLRPFESTRDQPLSHAVLAEVSISSGAACGGSCSLFSIHLPFPFRAIMGQSCSSFPCNKLEASRGMGSAEISASAEPSAHPTWTNRLSIQLSDCVLAWTQVLDGQIRLLGCGESKLQYCPTPSQQCTLDMSARLTLFQAIGNPGL